MRIILYLFFFLCCFPYIRFFNLGTNSDIQLYSILLAVPIVFLYILKEKEIPKFIASYGGYFIGVVFVLILISIAGGHSNLFLLFRGLASYIFFIFIPIATYYALKYISLANFGNFIQWCYWIWVVVGACQLIDRTFLTGWLGRTVITTDRGVISLSSEPAYFSITLIVLTLILLLIDPTKYGIYKYITFGVCFILAKSAVGLIYSTILILLIGEKNKNIVKKLALGIGALSIIVVLGFIYINVKPESRLALLILNIVTDPMGILMSDYSLNDRFANIYISFKYFFVDFFMPHGITSWGKIHISEIMSNPLFIYWGDISSWVNENGIATMIGAMLFELGILAIPYFVYICRIFNTLHYGKAILFLLLILGINGLNLTNPTFLLLIGLALYQSLTFEKVEVKSYAEMTKGNWLRAKTE